MLGKLQKVDLRQIWKNEATDFTPWLSTDENLALLGDAPGIGLEFVQREKSVGTFSADIVCKNVDDDSWILVENQLERTDHSHLGQLLTYAAGLDAVTVIWIAQSFTEPHRAALDWLNENTSERFSFFGIEIELWKIGDSPIAPKFNVVSKPNDWVKFVTRTRSSQEITEHQELQLDFWTHFHEYMSKRGGISCQKPRPQAWMTHTIGKSGVHLNSIVSFWDSESSGAGPELRVEFYMNSDKAKQQFDILKQSEAEINRSLSLPATWHNPENNKSCKIYVRKSIDFREKSRWPECFEWLRSQLEEFNRCFVPRLRALP